MTGQDKALATIRKLLAKAEDPATTPAEAQAYTAKAAEMIAAYGIDRALLAASQPDSDRPGDRIITVDPPYALDKADLLCGIATALRCRVVQLGRYRDGRKVTSIHLFGYASDIERTELLYTSLLVQAANGIAGAPIPFGEHPAAYRRSWLDGFTVAIVIRLRAAERHAEQQAQRHEQETGKSVALVLVSRADRIDHMVNDRYPDLRSGRARQLSGTGRARGYQAGQRADLASTTRLRAAPGRALTDGGS